MSTRSTPPLPPSRRRAALPHYRSPVLANAYLEPLQGARIKLLGGVPSVWKGMQHERMPAGLREAPMDEELGEEECCGHCTHMVHGRRCQLYNVMVDTDQLCNNFDWPRRSKEQCG